MKKRATTIENQNKEEVINSEILIIGFGLSIIPLIRELEKDNKDYIIISDGDTIWERLEKKERLNFDLVSSKHTSFYSFDLVHLDTKDNYPTSKEFLRFQKKYQTKYGSNVIKDWVTEIENYDTYSNVYTRKGKIYKAKNLLISTAFKRKMNGVISDFDFAATKNKTVALTGFGDSANLIISKLVPKNTKVILLTNGFLCLDKMAFHHKRSYTLDQLEMHNFRYISKFVYQTIVAGAGVVNVARILPKKLARFLFNDTLHVKFPLADRTKRIVADFKRRIKSPIPNGLIIVKYWPVDAYQYLFDNQDLGKSIQNGYLLNDIGFFLEKNLVEIVPKDDAIVDRDNNSIKWGNRTFEYDFIIDGNYEVPNLPKISYKSPDGKTLTYKYEYRNNYMGILPKELNNVYLIGYTRPSTGGLSNIIEMQCLLAHRMLKDGVFRKNIYKNLDIKLEKYNQEYYTTDKNKPTDHLVYYGYYIQDVAKLLGIAPKLSECRSLKEVLQFYLSPNNTFKYRQKGLYKVDGVKEMFEQIWKEHKGFSFSRDYIINYFLTQITIITFVCLLPIPLYVVIPLCLIQIMNPIMGLILSRGANLHGFMNFLLLIGLLTTIFVPFYWVPGISLIMLISIIIIGRKMGWTRVFFNDLKNKKQYFGFFEKYKKEYNKVL